MAASLRAAKKESSDDKKVKEADISDVFGMIKDRKMSGQEAKNLARTGSYSEQNCF